MKTSVRRIALLVLLQVAAADRAPAADGLPIVAGIKKASVAATEAAMDEQIRPQQIAMPDVPPATLPAQRLPQYQIGYYQSTTFSQAVDKEGRIEFLLNTSALGDRRAHPIKVSVQVLIDDQPFNRRRRDQAANLAEAVASAMTPKQPGMEPEAKAETKAKVKTPGETTQSSYRLESGADDFVRRYAAAVGDGEPVSTDEVDWLLTHWIEGPQLLMLQPTFQSFRGFERPVFTVLDHNGDQAVSADELQNAAESIRRCDANRDDIVDLFEITESAQALVASAGSESIAPAVIRLLPDLVRITRDDLASDSALRRLDTNDDGRLSAKEIDTLRSRPPDIQLVVDFQSADAQRSEIRLQNLTGELATAVAADRVDQTIVVTFGNLQIVFSAVQGQADSQVSLGAVIDGYPLVPSVDTNDDGRLTIRELRSVIDRLESRDRDGDGTLSSEEASPPLRVCIGLGGVVHQELATIRSSTKEQTPAVVKGPEWFVRMDRNKDNDLSRQEFPGTQQQFEALDADSDALVSASEALQFDLQPSNRSE